MVSRKTLKKKTDLKNFRSESFSIRTSEGRAPASELVLQRGILPSEIALQGGSLESKMVYRGVGADFEKPKKYFRLIMKKIYLENCKPLYTNKKKSSYCMQDTFARATSDALGQARRATIGYLVYKSSYSWTFLISPAVAGLFD